MQLLKQLFVGLIMIGWSACQSDVPNTPTPENTTPEATTPTNTETTRLSVTIDHLRLRDSPGTDGETLAMLRSGDVLFDAGRVSNFTTEVTLRGISYDEPWLKVTTEAGQTGWVYGGGVHFDTQQTSKSVATLLEKRLQRFFGGELSKDIMKNQQQWQRASTDRDIADLYATHHQLLEKANEVLEKKLPSPIHDDKQAKPDLRWLEGVFPGTLLGSAAEGTRYYLYQDFSKQLQQAKRTRGKADDDFIQLQLQLYPEDSIEYFFPVYKIQTWDYGGHSLLGAGHHQALLTAATTFRAKHPGYFETEVDAIKDAIVSDIVAAKGGYWLAKEKILKEIDEIVKAELGILTEKDTFALKEARQRIATAEKNNIQVNIRAGME